MIFWRKKNDNGSQQREEAENKLLHHEGEPNLEPPTEYDADIDPDTKHKLEQTDIEIINDLNVTPVPEHTPLDDTQESEALRDHSEEGGWFSRLTAGLGKSAAKITQNLTDIITKSKLDQDTLDQLEEMLIEADLGPATAARVIGEFSHGRFGSDISENEIRESLAETIANILKSVAQKLEIPTKDSPFVMLVCGVNGAGKTTTIGKYAHYLKNNEGKKVLIAAADTFRAAAIDQLAEWAKRAGAEILVKDIGADAAAVAYEAYLKAKKDKADVLIIDTAGRLQNKAGLMAELEKIIRVLKKQDENIPHAVILVLDATTGQNAFSQVEAFRDMVKVTGLMVTKLDGSARGGVLVGLADKFEVPVHAIGVGEGIHDLRPFKAIDYARSLMGLEPQKKS